MLTVEAPDHTTQMVILQRNAFEYPLEITVIGFSIQTGRLNRRWTRDIVYFLHESGESKCLRMNVVGRVDG